MPPSTRSTSTSSGQPAVKKSKPSEPPALAVRAAGDLPRQLRAADFGCTLPSSLHGGKEGVRQRVLLDTLARLEDASADARYHMLAQRNLARWAAAQRPSCSECKIVVLPGDWGEVTHRMTKEFGATFAALNMANAFGPGGGYVDGMVAQEENMFRRTDCHFSLDRAADMQWPCEEYNAEHTALLSAADGRVYLDAERPRVCVRGPEDRSREDLGYAWLPDTEVFPFYELRAAGVDLRDWSLTYDQGETVRRVSAQLDTLIDAGVRHAVLSAFGCGAFLNPADKVAAAYKTALQTRRAHFDVICFAIFDAGYGPSNFEPFERAFASP